MSIRHLTFDDSQTILYSALTGSFQNLLSLSDDADFVFVFNTCDQPIILSVPSGSASTKSLRFPKQTSLAIDCRTNSKRIAKGIIQVKYAGSAPTQGEVTVFVAR